MLCDVWYDIIDPVGGDFGLFYAGNGGSNPAKLSNLCNFFESRKLSQGAFATLFCFARAGYQMDFDPLLICCVFFLEKKRREHKI